MKYSLLGALLLAPFLAQSHPDRIESGLKLHFATGTHPIENNQWSDLLHNANAKVHGGPVFTNIGPAQALVFDGFDAWLEVASSPEEAVRFLPKKAFTVSAWVVLEETAEYGGICGLIQDNGSFEKGWLLGYDNNHFYLAASSADANKDGDGTMTYLRGTQKIELGRWYHVAGVYDGMTMKLFVNGKLESESTAQSGEILYPARGKFAIAAYQDDNEQHLWKVDCSK